MPSQPTQPPYYMPWSWYVNYNGPPLPYIGQYTPPKTVIGQINSPTLLNSPNPPSTVTTTNPYTFDSNPFIQGMLKPSGILDTPSIIQPVIDIVSADLKKALPSIEETGLNLGGILIGLILVLLALTYLFKDELAAGVKVASKLV